MARRLLLVGVTSAGLTALGIGVASLTAASASASSGVAAAQVVAAATPVAPPANSGTGNGMNPENCPNMSGSGNAGSASGAT